MSNTIDPTSDLNLFVIKAGSNQHAAAEIFLLGAQRDTIFVPAYKYILIFMRLHSSALDLSVIFKLHLLYILVDEGVVRYVSRNASLS